MQEATLAGAGGQNLFLRSWRPDQTPRGVVVIVHGFNAHSGYYQWTAEQLVAAGLAVYALDLRGRGRSQGERYYVERFADYVADLASLMAEAKQREPGLPIYLLGHSAGGVVACLYALDRPSDLAGLICESFAFRTPAPGFVLAVFRALSHLIPHARAVRLNSADFSRDKAAVQAMQADPFVKDEVQPIATMAALARADDVLEKALSRIALPVLILHGDADKAAKPSGSQYFHKQAASRDKTLKLYEGYFHDPLNDLGKEVVISDILAWIRARLPAA